MDSLLWRVCCGEFHDLYSSPRIIQVIKSRWMICAGHIASVGEGEAHMGVWWGNLREKKSLGKRVMGGGIKL